VAQWLIKPYTDIAFRLF